MRTWRGYIAVWGLLVVLTCWAPAAMAQDPAAPDDPAPAEPPADVTGREFEEQKFQFGLYVYVAGGNGSSDPLGTSIAAGPLDTAVSSVEFTDQLYGRAALGWQMKDARKGDFRLVTQGLREEEYEFLSEGVSNRVTSGVNAATADLNCALNTGEGDSAKDCLVRWWQVSAKNGNFEAVRLPPIWDATLDATFGDGDGAPDFGPCVDLGGGMERCGEVMYDANDPNRRVISGEIADDLQNQLQTFDALYGREFGGRRFSSRWFAGLRYFTYEGQMLAGAWLSQGQGSLPGEHFTDGAFLNLLRITQETSGFGPIGSWEADLNFFDRGVVIYARAEVAFTVNTMEMDSGPFFRIFQEGDSSNPAVLVPDRMSKKLDKSTWQTKGEVGGRLNFKNGLSVEAAWSRTGYLDIVLMPDLLQLGGEQVSNANPQTFTQDLVVDMIHAGVGFQF